MLAGGVLAAVVAATALAVATIDPEALNNEKYQTAWQNLISG